MPVLGMVTLHELIQALALERIFLEDEMHVRAQVVNPELFGPRFSLRGFAVEEQDVGFDALRVKIPVGSRGVDGLVDLGGRAFEDARSGGVRVSGY